MSEVWGFLTEHRIGKRRKLLEEVFGMQELKYKNQQVLFTKVKTVAQPIFFLRESTTNISPNTLTCGPKSGPFLFFPLSISKHSNCSCPLSHPPLFLIHLLLSFFFTICSVSCASYGMTITSSTTTGSWLDWGLWSIHALWLSKSAITTTISICRDGWRWFVEVARPAVPTIPSLQIMHL